MKFPFREASPCLPRPNGVGEEPHNPSKLMFDIEIGEVYSVNQEVDIGEEMLMKLRLLLFILYQKLKKAAKKNAAYRSFLGNMQVKIMIKTADGKHGRLFIFDRGKLSTLTGGDTSL